MVYLVHLVGLAPPESTNWISLDPENGNIKLHRRPDRRVRWLIRGKHTVPNQTRHPQFRLAENFHSHHFQIVTLNKGGLPMRSHYGWVVKALTTGPGGCRIETQFLCGIVQEFLLLIHQMGTRISSELVKGKVGRKSNSALTSVTLLPIRSGSKTATWLVTMGATDFFSQG